MERLKIKKRIGNVGGVVYFAASTELEKRKLAFVKECGEPSLDSARGAAVYQCAHPGCPEMVREPGFCREHGPKPHIAGMALTVQQAADELGVSRMGIYRLAKNGSLKIRKAGGRSLISRTELESIIK